MGKVCETEASGTVGGEIPKAFRVSQPRKESSPGAKHIGNGPRTGNRRGYALSIHLLDNMNQDITVLDGKSMWKYF